MEKFWHSEGISNMEHIFSESAYGIHSLLGGETGGGFPSLGLSVSTLWAEPQRVRPTRSHSSHPKQHRPGDRNSIHRKPQLPHFTGLFIWDVPCLTVTARGQKSSKQSRCLSKKWPCKQERTACSLSRLGPLAVLWVFLFFRPETVSANSWGFPKPYSSGGQASSDIIFEWCGAERGSHARPSRGNTNTIAGSERAAASVVRETRRAFSNSAWHSVGIQAVGLEQNWLPHCASGIWQRWDFN